MITDEIKEEDLPTYGVSQVASLFFGLTSHWIRWLDSQGAILYDEDGRVSSSGERWERGKVRSYTLRDVEVMIDILQKDERISDQSAELARRMIEAIVAINRLNASWRTHEGRDYDLSVEDVSREIGKSVPWVRTHAERLGGVKKRWNRSTESWRFNREDLQKALSDTTEESPTRGSEN